MLFGATLPNILYFKRALKHYRLKFGNATVFIATSDDYEYLESELSDEKDVFLAKGNSPTEDMALLSSCNHSIITMGSFSFWAGYLTGGEVVYPDVLTIKEYR
ncbi:Glycosyl transferase 11 [Halocaridina rubra]|uniref:L-Fucosyltransferase n=1 Tax=Halocaridina rubra TaxID=373956 RepID=A0AAN8WZH8_HALRR